MGTQIYSLQMDTGRIPLTQHRDAHGTADGGSRGTDQSTTGIRPLVRRRRHSRRRRGVEDTAEVAEAGEQHADPELHLPGMATVCKSRARREGIRKRREGGGAGLTEEQPWQRRRTEHPARRPASIWWPEPVSSPTGVRHSARRCVRRHWGPAAAPRPVALPMGRIRVASPALPPPLPFSEARARWAENLRELPDGRSRRRPNRSAIGRTVLLLRQIRRPER